MSLGKLTKPPEEKISVLGKILKLILEEGTENPDCTTIRLLKEDTDYKNRPGCWNFRIEYESLTDYEFSLEDPQGQVEDIQGFGVISNEQIKLLNYFFPNFKLYIDFTTKNYGTIYIEKNFDDDENIILKKMANNVKLKIKNLVEKE